MYLKTGVVNDKSNGIHATRAEMSESLWTTLRLLYAVLPLGLFIFTVIYIVFNCGIKFKYPKKHDTRTGRLTMVEEGRGESHISLKKPNFKTNGNVDKQSKEKSGKIPTFAKLTSNFKTASNNDTEGGTENRRRKRKKNRSTKNEEATPNIGKISVDTTVTRHQISPLASPTPLPPTRKASPPKLPTMGGAWKQTEEQLPLADQIKNKLMRSKSDFQRRHTQQTQNTTSISSPPAAFVQMIKNAKTIVRLANETVSEMSDTEDPITADLRSVAELHLTEIEEAWIGLTTSESLPDLILFTSFIETKCVVISDLHHTYSTYMAIKLGLTASGSHQRASSSSKFRKLNERSSAENAIEEDEEDIYMNSKCNTFMPSSTSKDKVAASTTSVKSAGSASATSLVKRHRSRLKKITQKLRGLEEQNPKYQSTSYWKKKVDKMFDRTQGETDYDM